jgi:hypothetical protein
MYGRRWRCSAVVVDTDADSVVSSSSSLSSVLGVGASNDAAVGVIVAASAVAAVLGRVFFQK